jgi:hypothetical protein
MIRSGLPATTSSAVMMRSLAEACLARSAKMSTPPAISTSSETHPIAEVSELSHSWKNTFGHSGKRSGQALGGTWLAGAEHGQQDHANHGYGAKDDRYRSRRNQLRRGGIEPAPCSPGSVSKPPRHQPLLPRFERRTT